MSGGYVGEEYVPEEMSGSQELQFLSGNNCAPLTNWLATKAETCLHTFTGVRCPVLKRESVTHVTPKLVTRRPIVSCAANGCWWPHQIRHFICQQNNKQKQLNIRTDNARHVFGVNDKNKKLSYRKHTARQLRTQYTSKASIVNKRRTISWSCFHCSGPAAYIRLPCSIRKSSSVNSFKTALKTFATNI